MTQNPPVVKSIFNEIQPGSFGAVWWEASRPHLRHVVDLLKDLFTCVNTKLPTITCVLSLDHEVSPIDNRGKCAVSDLHTPLHNPRAWATFVRQLRTDHAYQDVVRGLVSRLFGMRLTFQTVPLAAFEVYTWQWPWELSIQALSHGASVQTMTFTPLPLLEELARASSGGAVDT